MQIGHVSCYTCMRSPLHRQRGCYCAASLRDQQVSVASSARNGLGKCLRILSVLRSKAFLQTTASCMVHPLMVGRAPLSA